MTSHAPPQPDLTSFRTEATNWLEQNATRRATDSTPRSDRVAVFGGGTREDERRRFVAAREWQQRKHDAGFGSISWPQEYGGAGLPRAFDDEFRLLESEFETPERVEVLTISLGIESPTILSVGTDEQRRFWLPKLRRTDLVCCQLFSEPGAGSDLGALSLRAEPDGDDWVLTGQKVWTSGAHLADYGVTICRTDRSAPTRSAMTAFLVPMDADGLTIRPIRQMTDGSGFNEVFFEGVRISDALRLGAVGEGWSVAMTILGFERSAVARDLGAGGTDLLDRLIELAQTKGKASDSLIRKAAADIYVRNRTRAWAAQRVLDRADNGIPGPESSILKIAYSRELRACGELASSILGPSLVADTGEWGTFAWSDLISGVPGVRLGGGTDEIQKNTLAERVLGLPREAR